MSAGPGRLVYRYERRTTGGEDQDSEELGCLEALVQNTVDAAGFFEERSTCWVHGLAMVLVLIRHRAALDDHERRTRVIVPASSCTGLNGEHVHFDVRGLFNIYLVVSIQIATGCQSYDLDTGGLSEQKTAG